MKLSVAVAGENAPPSAFVVWRGFDRSIPKAAEFGYHGVELALKTADEVDPGRLARRLDEFGIQVSAITTGQVFAGLGLYFTHPDTAQRERTFQVFRDLMRLAADFGGIVNVGRARGFVADGQPRERTEALFIDMARRLCDEAAPLGVEIVIEPVNRYEINFINNLDEAAALLERVDRGNIGLMPDVFHMNIEDARIGESLARHGRRIRYVHLADSNRLAPGQGHLDFGEVFAGLERAGFDGWAAIEILPIPDADTAARQAAEAILPMIGARARAVSGEGRGASAAEKRPPGRGRVGPGEIERMQRTAQELRMTVVEMIHRAGSGHVGGSLSAAEILTVLYDAVMRLAPAGGPPDPAWPDRDRFILSKGHASPALYATLARKGFFDPRLLEGLRRIDSPLQGHPFMRDTPGVEMSTGSLGMGLSVGVGMALAGRARRRRGRVFVLCGDGELQEGQNWEAMMAAAKWSLSGLTLIVDRNGVQLDGPVGRIMPLGDLPGKLRAFGWRVHECDGHDVESLLEALAAAEADAGRANSPAAVIAHTVKGKGVSFMEGQAAWHGRPIGDSEYARAVAELREGLRRRFGT